MSDSIPSEIPLNFTNEKYNRQYTYPAQNQNPNSGSKDTSSQRSNLSSAIPKPHIAPLPKNAAFSAAHLHQIRSQIIAYKVLNTGNKLSDRLKEGIQGGDLPTPSSLYRAKAQQKAEASFLAERSVPGKSLSRGADYYWGGLKGLQASMASMRKTQAALRKDVLGESLSKKDMSHTALEAGLLDRSYYRRAVPQSFRTRQEAKVLGKYEQAMRNGQELKKRNQQAQFLTQLLNYHREFFEFHKKKHGLLRKQAYGSKNFLDYIERQEIAKKEKFEKERLRALKENDMDAYIELINTTKNDRLLQILHQTDKFLRQLGAKVRVQKGEELEEGLDNEEDDQLSGNQIAESLKTASKTYYYITHTIHEQVKEQPKGIEGGLLKSYQLDGLRWLVSLYNNNLHGVLADEMGLGKTIQTIALFQYLIENKNNCGPFLVVVPLSTLSNWVLELKKWAPKIRVVVYKGPPAHRRHIIFNALNSRKFNVLLTTYEYIMKDKQQLSKIHWSYIVVDEGHRMKNAKSKFAQILGLQYTSDHRLLLTGTPLQNNLAELWSLLNFLLPKIFNSLDDFEKWFNQPFNRIPGEDVELNEEESLLVINRLHQVLRPFLLRRVKKDVEAELPDKIEFVLKVELSSWQRKLYKEIQEKGFLAKDPSTGRPKNLNNSVMQLRKVCNHPYLFTRFDHFDFITDEIWRSSGKFELLDRILPKFIATNHKILIFCQMTQLMDIMQLYFDFKGYRYLRLDGTTKSEDREKRMQLFNAPNSEYHIFLLSTRAGGLGLNLQAADTVIIYDSDWNPQMDLQAQDRAHRIGQKEEVRVYRLVTNTKIEETILTKAAYKKDVDAKVIQAGLFNAKATDLERREKLRSLLKTEEEDEEEEQPYMTDPQINEVIARNDEEYEAFEKLDMQRKLVENYDQRLIQEDQMPEWLGMTEAEKEEFFYGRGLRERKRVYYADFTDAEWENMIEGKKRPSGDLQESPNKVPKHEEENPDTKITISSGRIVHEEESELDEDEDFCDDIYMPYDDDY